MKMKKYYLVLLVILLSSCVTTYQISEQTFMKYDEVENDFYKTDSLLGQIDEINIKKDEINIFILGQDPINIKIIYESIITVNKNGENVKAELYDGIYNDKECRLLIFRKQKYINFYHTYNSEINFYTELIVFKINK